MKRVGAVLGWMALAPVVIAGPVDDCRQGVDMAINLISANGQVTGIVSMPITSSGAGWTTVTKPAGSLNATVSLAALAPDLALDFTGVLTGSELPGDKIKWAVSSPDAIDKFISIEVSGTLYNVKIRSVSGTLTVTAGNRVPTKDPLTGEFRNVDLVKDAASPNVLEVKGWVDGLFFLPVTVTLDDLDYGGLAGFAPLQTVSGSVNLQDFVGNVAGTSVVVDVRTEDSSTAIETHVVTLDALGGYSFQTSLWGSHDISAKGSHWLRQVRSQVDLDGTRTSEDFSLVNGDVDGDNAVTVFDYAALSDAFDTLLGDAAWNAEADLDGDGAVTVFDYAILSANFDAVGAD